MQSTLQTTTIPSQLSLLASPPPTFIDDTLPSYLSLAMIHTLRQSTRVAVRREIETERELEEEGLNNGMPNKANVGEGKVEERVEGGLRERLHTIGVSVGGHIAERSVIPLIHRLPNPKKADDS
jgi:trafficking protein particle complex subunit 6